MTQDAGDETGQQLAVDLRRVATDIALGATAPSPGAPAGGRDARRGPGGRGGGARGRSEPDLHAVRLPSEQARDDVLGEPPAQGQSRRRHSVSPSLLQAEHP